MALGVYISVPFCRSKCSYCNFASDVFSRAVHQSYVNRVCDSMEHASRLAEQLGVRLERVVDSIFIGGGTPTVLDLSDLERLFVAIRSTFDLERDAEITVECAPGTINPAILEMFRRCGVNRVSLGVQSFVDREAASVGRLHKRETVMNDVSRLRAAGIENINIDLIAGLPHQTAESWKASLDRVIALEAPHVSIYMLEVDQDSRLGRELIAGGTRYHAHFAPDEDAVADFYEEACERLNAAGITQYEISNFCQVALESRHNLKYWTRQPYLGFGVDAHSMLFAGDIGNDAALNGYPDALTSGGEDREGARFCTPDSLEEFMAGRPPEVTPISPEVALEEAFFLGLRLTRGVNLHLLEEQFGMPAMAEVAGIIADCISNGLMESVGQFIRLTPRGRLLSNEVFQRFISVRT